ncbi:aminopeptidase N [Aestuariicella hydrocarbonica]|uniref:Aminopeptidase N n=1 Tax=Pseudomaricurvus hydrocarbonicus TaxID=1470433 RepID=A0A9E5JU34_9GAMM|nr:aminopeptidase N [Aestuariicella hydrocarbonica]NHO65329.1 aminopeptidase N [Aestuariicella hydrocarbonica]
MKDAQPKSIYLKDYKRPDFLIEKTELHFTLDPSETLVQSRLEIRRNPEANTPAASLVLHGQELELISLSIDGHALSSAGYDVGPEALTISTVPDEFVFEAVVKINPEGNTSLEGLYKSRTMYCTQCEAEGFRKITYYLDRPDVMSEFLTTIEASESDFPVLLSNGNLIASGEADSGKHFATWHDPFKKPAYLFALVAGTLDYVEDTFTTQSGRDITLRIFVESKDIDKCDHAMRSLKNAMRWDEEVYGLEYDLDIFMIVAVDDFNMGAMENKGLNIFNTSCVLAKPETTTDAGFQRVESVVAHEYFHNWSGNRVTCRDWFQLSLKEGFTVFRDSQFSADMNSQTVKRVEDVSVLRTLQFAEDGGPMAHPVRPPSFIEISNFYTLTVYEKGSEVVGMIHTLLGAENFRTGSDLYFSRHDGEAATIEDFVAAMEEASGRDLAQFTRWYSQAGTPRVVASDTYNEDSGTYTLTLAQSCPTTPEAKAEEKLPFHIPIAMGLLGDAGNLPIQLQGQPADPDTDDNTNIVLELTEPEQTFVFEGVTEKPTPVLLRGFSAPVKLHYDYSREQLTAIMSRDSDGFSRWDACQKLAVAVLEDVMQAYRGDQAYRVDPLLVAAYRAILIDTSLDKAMVALMLQLPTEAYLSEIATEIDVEAIHFARQYVRKHLAAALSAQLEAVYQASNEVVPFSVSASAIASRSLKNTVLSYLICTDTDENLQLAQQQLANATNMTDELSGLTAIINSELATDAQRKTALDEFYQRWSAEALVVNQWLVAQANVAREGGLERVMDLIQHEAFDIKNPNKVRSVIGAFCSGNPVNFHRQDGAGYEFLADQILVLNKLNPQIASRLLTPLTKWRKYDKGRQTLMCNALQRVLAEPALSKDVYEVVSKSLKD